MNDHYHFLPITTSVPSAAHAIHRFARELVSHGTDAAVIFEAVVADPECALANAYAAALYLSQMTRQGSIMASPHIIAAQALCGPCSSRETATIDAIAAWGRGDVRRAISILRSVVEAAPYDLVAAKFCQILELTAGDTRGMLTTSAMAAAVESRSSYALGLHAFALEQAGHSSLALRFARRAIDSDPDSDPWAQHAAAHAMIAMDQGIEARAFLHGVSHSWQRCSSFMRTHNWWHLGLLELENNNRAGAIDLLDRQVWGVRKGHVQDQLNAISLLARLEFNGVDAAQRWDDIAAHVEPRVKDGINDFIDLHYLIALARSGRDAAAVELVQRLTHRSVTGALARGILAHARGDYSKAITEIGGVRRQICEIGGSNVQRELFEQFFLDSFSRINSMSAGIRVAA
jgi:tetratricopeptide (TPR) repeat protein